MAKPIIIANWKMNPVILKEAREIFGSVCKKAKNINAEIVFCPPFVYFSIFFAQFPNNVKIGAQNCFIEQKGAFTGEVSAIQLFDLGCKYVIAGHSERRRYFLETDETVNKKIKIILENKMIPVLCVGETQEQRDAGQVQEVLKRQIKEGLDGVSSSKILKESLLIAYEPVWAIGTGRPCDVEEGQKMRLLIKKVLANIYNQNISNHIGILYGGSVNASNSVGYIKEAEFSGLLVGGASLDPKEFSQIINNSI